ncbi:MAG: hypothetical protein H5U30_06990, partial [Marinobacter sp.]|nr:hypothetical protein [Marinobacter sp.]
RLLMFPIGALMLWPHGQILLDGAGVLIFVAVLVWSSRRGRSNAAAVAGWQE